MICATCTALEFASDDALRALVRWQATQLDRLTGGHYDPPPTELLVDNPTEQPSEPPLLPVVELVLSYEDVFRRPPRAAAPRLIQHLADAGWTFTRENE